RSQVSSYSIGPLLGELLIEIDGPRAVSVSIHFHLDFRIGQQDSRDFRQTLPRPGFRSDLPVSNNTSGMLTMSPRAESRVSSTWFSWFIKRARVCSFSCSAFCACC